jgi:hypothetical protein
MRSLLAVLFVAVVLITTSASRVEPLFDSVQVKAQDKGEIRFNAPAIPEGLDAVLLLKARLTFDAPAGYTWAMRLLVNGTPLDIHRLLNKKPQEERADGSMSSIAAGNGDLFAVDYSPDFDATDTHPLYALKRPGLKSSVFEFKVSGLIHEGTNTLGIENNISAALGNTLIIGEARLEFRSPLSMPRKQGPPEGSLPQFVPSVSHRVDYEARLEADSGITLTFAGQTLHIESEFSTPEPKWQKGSNAFFTLAREIELRDEALIVRDTFTNLTSENLPIMQRHRIPLTLTGVWLAGLSPAGMKGGTADPQNPTTFGMTEHLGVGLLPLDDVFQVHVNNSSTGEAIGLSDDQFVLTPGATHTAEWGVVPVPTKDYFAFINAVRRLRDVNFPIAGSFAFLRADPQLTGSWTDDQFINFARFKDALYLCNGIDSPRYHGFYPHGTAFQAMDTGYRIRHISRLRGLLPDVKHLVYFHCFIDVLEEAEKKYADARLLRGDGSQAIYGEPQDKIFIPTESNSFGRDVGKNVDLILGDIGADGVYWDEMEYSAFQYHYGEPWDGTSADIDPTTLKISRLKSSVTLLSQPWRMALAQRILAHGPLIANGAPHTRTMATLHFPRFVETGAISNCARAQMFTPIALGDHLTERSEADAYQVMLRALDFGCVYYWYNDLTVIPEYPTLTHYMFPFTPIELGKGFVIGKERILTNRSGLFGWGDKADHEIHVFNEEGREVEDIQPPTVARVLTRDGATLTELRLGEGWSAAIVRKNSPR